MRASTPGSPSAAAAPRAFLKSLPADLRATASFPLEAPERLAWNFVPMDRVGVSLLKLDDAQSELLGPLLATALSPEGLLAARGVMKHENILRRVETEAGVANASRRDPGLYYTAIFGKPAAAAAWGWRFEGHHLSINVTELPGEAPVVAPMFVGANPARVLAGPNAGFRLLAAEEDLGRELIKMLPAARRESATIRDTAFSEILTGNDPKVQKLELEGLAAADMTAAEKAQLRRLIELYVGRMTPASARDALLRLDRAGFDKVRFAWAGGIEPGQPHYYRVHGPRCSSSTTTRRTTPITSTPCIAISNAISAAMHCARTIEANYRSHRQLPIAAARGAMARLAASREE